LIANCLNLTNYLHFKSESFLPKVVMCSDLPIYIAADLIETLAIVTK